MKVSKREDFAILLMSVLARNFSQEFLSLSEVSRRTGLSSLFLKHIALDLKKRGLISSREGIGGGYRLSKRPEEISIAQILDTAGKGIVRTSCGGKKVCSQAKENCLCHHFWDSFNSRMAGELEKTKLADIIST